MTISLVSLPAELVEETLAYLALRDLLSFSITNKTYYGIAKRSLRQLNLVVLPNKTLCQIAVTTEPNHSDGWNVIKTTERLVDRLMDNRNLYRTIVQRAHPTALLEEQIAVQNRLAAEVFCRANVINLRKLTLQMFDLRSANITSSIAQMSRLQDLELKFCHSYTNGQMSSSIPYNYWRQAPEGQACWNALVGLGSEHQQQLKMRGLRHLHIERAGLTTTQLRSLIEKNPKLNSLYLDNVTGVDHDFTSWMCRRSSSAKSFLKTVELSDCANLRFDGPQAAVWVVQLANSGIEHLTIAECRHMNVSALVIAIQHDKTDTWKHVRISPIPDTSTCITINQLCRTECGTKIQLKHIDNRSVLKCREIIEVDPAYA